MKNKMDKEVLDKLVTMDSYYGFVPCFDFILLDPKNPGELIFDKTDEEMIEMIDG